MCVVYIKHCKYVMQCWCKHLDVDDSAHCGGAWRKGCVTCACVVAAKDDIGLA